MMASHRRLPLYLTAFFLTCFAASALTTPGYAKTRPPIEAGDPDVGNNKPQDGPRVSSSMMWTQASTRVEMRKTRLGAWIRTYLEYLVPTLWRG